MRTNNGVLAVVSGPSGAGKGTVVSALINSCGSCFLSVSATTRPPREGEIPGKHYNFVSRDEFEDMIKKGELLEYAEYAGNYYGTPRRDIDLLLSEGKDVILEIDMQGGTMVREKRADAVLIFLTPPLIGDIEKRLRGRNTESEDSIKKRLETARRELSGAGSYDYIVINDSVDMAVEDIRCILRAERCSASRNPLAL
ncbi:MAG: guanylate kinase [Oscillospiraceae bacterium]|nr:guanylate kinase [Oscillospiraceae bacterium]